MNLIQNSSLYEFVPAKREEISVAGLIKFGESKYMEQFRDEGIVMLRSLDDYKKMEGDLCRHDEYEGEDFVWYGGELTIGNHCEERKLSKENGLISVSISQADRCWKAYCMYAIIINGGCLQEIDSRTSEFGDTVAVIRDASEFLKRFTKSLEKSVGKSKLSARSSLVEYIDIGNHDGPVGPFRKDKRYSYQSEYRIVAQTSGVKANEPIFLELGSLRDIVFLSSSTDLNSRIALI